MRPVRLYYVCRNASDKGIWQTVTKKKQIVIYGKSGHAEVLGLVGQTDGKAIVIEKAEEAKSWI